MLRVLILRVWCRIRWAAWLSGIGLAPGPAYGCPVDRTSKTVSAKECATATMARLCPSLGFHR